MRTYLFCHIIALTAGILLDWIIGDPHGLPHPVRAIGRLISALERKLLGDTDASTARNRARERAAGTLLWILVTAVTVLVTGSILCGAYLLHPGAGIACETILTAYLLAAGSLCRESMQVAVKLEDEDIASARTAVSMIVGRDTEKLNREEIITAAVETVAENTSDGVIAPLLFAAVGGPILGFFYKAVNTMDSMLGYRNERYADFGRTAARADDVMNFLPSRISAMVMIPAGFLLGIFSADFSGRGALRIWRRDRRKHLSPNAAQTESACAGALGIALGGTHEYGGVPVEKPVIGDAGRPPQTADIGRANALMFVTQILTAALLLAVLVLLTGMPALRGGV
ncbi:MAG: adenosylcobinamide-phosphate synthase CbiB [Lachnospiraceae bacterium]|nr:adenosylcobinamide-phosphate synthase CbiB [Lachnospiraceae bacterium]